MKTTTVSKWSEALEFIREAHLSTTMADSIELTNILDEISAIVDEQKAVLNVLGYL